MQRVYRQFIHTYNVGFFLISSHPIHLVRSGYSYMVEQLSIKLVSITETESTRQDRQYQCLLWVLMGVHMRPVIVSTQTMQMFFLRKK
jgi:hypothetical protein